MTIVAQSNTNSNTWSVLRKQDTFGFGYQAQDSQFDGIAIREGWELMFNGMPAELAIKFRDIYRTAGTPQTELTATPSLDDLLVFDFSEDIETRAGQTVQEYDLVKIQLNGVYVDAVVTYYDADTVEFDGFIEVSRQYAENHMELIAKADAECGFVTENNRVIDEQRERMNDLYQIAVRVEQTLQAA